MNFINGKMNVYVDHFIEKILPGYNPLYYLMGATLCITAFPLLLLRVLHSRPLPALLNLTLVSFGIGALLGDVGTHILPEAFEKAYHNHQGPTIGLYFVLGVLCFWILETVVDTISHGHDDTDTSQSFDHNDNKDAQPIQEVKEEPTPSKSLRSRKTARKSPTSRTTDDSPSRDHKARQHLHHHNHLHHDSHKSKSSMTSVLLPSIFHTSNAYLTQLLSWLTFAHIHLLVTDGLTLALTYMATSKAPHAPLTPLITTLAILCHEIPHKLGEFTIVKLRSDAATAWKICIAGSLGTWMGVLFGVVGLGSTISSLEETSWLMPFLGGGLLYGTLTGILPDLNEISLFKDKLIDLSVKMLGILSGAFLMYQLAFLHEHSHQS